MAESLQDVLNIAARRGENARLRNGVPEIEFKKPVSADPETGELLTLEQVASGRAEPVSLDGLDKEKLQSLVSERLRLGPDHVIQVLGGRTLDKAQMLDEIARWSQIGQQLVQAERLLISYVMARYNAGRGGGGDQGEEREREHAAHGSRV